MRNPNRIPNLLQLLGQAWLANPDTRLGQLVSNAASIGGWRDEKDVFYCEDDVMTAGLVQMAQGDIDIPPGGYTYLVIGRPRTEEDSKDYSLVFATKDKVAAERWVMEQHHGNAHNLRRYIIVRD